MSKGLLPTHYERRKGAVDNSTAGGGELPLSMAGNSSDYYDTLINMWLLTGKQARLEHDLFSAHIQSL